MTRRSVIVLLLSAAGIPVLGQAPNFDKLSASDKKVFLGRFEKEIWPLLQRGGKDGCVGCHSGKIVSSLHLSGDAAKDFAFMLRDGFFIPGDPGSVLERLVDPSKERRMPKGKAPWSEADIKVVRAFVTDLDKKQQR